MSDHVDVHEQEEEARQIAILHRNLSIFVNGAHLPVLIGSLTMLLTEIILDVADSEEHAHRLAGNFSNALKLALEITYRDHNPSEYVQ